MGHVMFLGWSCGLGVLSGYKLNVAGVYTAGVAWVAVENCRICCRSCCRKLHKLQELLSQISKSAVMVQVYVCWTERMWELLMVGHIRANFEASSVKVHIPNIPVQIKTPGPPNPVQNIPNKNQISNTTALGGGKGGEAEPDHPNLGQGVPTKIQVQLPISSQTIVHPQAPVHRPP